MQMRRCVAITGLGLVTPLGNSTAATWQALLEGHSGIAPISSFDAAGYPVRIAAEVKNFDPSMPDGHPGQGERQRSASHPVHNKNSRPLLFPLPDQGEGEGEGDTSRREPRIFMAGSTQRKLLKYAPRHARFALAAAAEAIDDAGISPSPETATRWGCVTGSGMMGVAFGELAQFQRHFAAGGELVSRALFDPAAPAPDPIAYARNQANTGLALLVQCFGIRGYASSIHTACASGGQAIGLAMRLIRRGGADFVLAGGFDSMINPVGLAGFCMLGALSTDNDAPQSASRPFDRTRNGFVLGEGAGFLVLEEWQAARRRGARIYAEIAGDGNSLSSYRITDSHPSGDGPIQAMRRALEDAGAEPGEVGYINAHGTSTVMNDRSECAAVKAVFGAHAAKVKVSSTKSLMGHLIAGAGAVEAAICALAIHHTTLPASANLDEPDPQCDLNFVRPRPSPLQSGLAISNSFGFGGSNSCLIFRNPEEVAR
jgi:3-oxoacyl-(acyl-carrier-protein) synthase